MNCVIMMGRLCADAEVRYSSGATPIAIARFSIAVDRRYKREGDPTADFFNCSCFGKQAEFVEKYLHKGTKVVISGRLENNDYTNRDGQRVRDNRIIAESIEFAESKKTAEENKESAPKSNNNSDDGFMNILEGIDEELPFS